MNVDSGIGKAVVTSFVLIVESEDWSYRVRVGLRSSLGTQLALYIRFPKEAVVDYVITTADYLLAYDMSKCSDKEAREEDETTAG